MNIMMAVLFVFVLGFFLKRILYREETIEKLQRELARPRPIGLTELRVAGALLKPGAEEKDVKAFCEALIEEFGRIKTLPRWQWGMAQIEATLRRDGSESKAEMTLAALSRPEAKTERGIWQVCFCQVCGFTFAAGGDVGEGCPCCGSWVNSTAMEFSDYGRKSWVKEEKKGGV